MTRESDVLTGPKGPWENTRMKDVILHLDFDMGLPKEELIKIFNAEIEKFSKWLGKAPTEMQQGALTKPERILMLTYFMQKYAGNLDKE